MACRLWIERLLWQYSLNDFANVTVQSLLDLARANTQLLVNTVTLCIPLSRLTSHEHLKFQSIQSNSLKDNRSEKLATSSPFFILFNGLGRKFRCLWFDQGLQSCDSSIVLVNYYHAELEFENRSQLIRNYIVFTMLVNDCLGLNPAGLTLNTPITTSRLLKCLRSFYGKQCGSRSDCSYRSSLFWVHTVCFFT